MKRLYLLTLISVSLAVIIFVTKNRRHTTASSGEGLVIPREWLKTNEHPKTPATDVRPPDQTFLTFPEWYLVFSPEEQAQYFAHTTSTTFPFMTHTRQIWESYKIVNDQIKDVFPPNDGYHLMIRVIGVSSSVEYGVKSWYELTVGRLTDTGSPMTAEDFFNAKYTREYVDFINDLPWYQFDFKKQFSELWNTPVFGNNMLRKLERRYILTSELMVKYAYGKLIGFGTEQVYDEALLTTAVVLENDSLVILPRYNRFANAATELAMQNHSFKEIAGNTSAIMVTVLTDVNQPDSFPGTTTVFTQLISSNPSKKRIAVSVPVSGLHTILLDVKAKGVELEHVFDF